MAGRMKVETGTEWLGRLLEGYVMHFTEEYTIAHIVLLHINLKSAWQLNHLNDINPSQVVSNLPCILFSGSRSRRGSPHSHCCPREGCGNDKTLHADRNQYPPPQRYRFWGGRLFWLPLPLLWGDLVRHPDCILCDCSLHLHCGKVREMSRTPETHRTRALTNLLHKTFNTIQSVKLLHWFRMNRILSELKLISAFVSLYQGWVHVNGVSQRQSQIASHSSTVYGTLQEPSVCKVIFNINVIADFRDHALKSP